MLAALIKWSLNHIQETEATSNWLRLWS